MTENKEQLSKDDFKLTPLVDQPMSFMAYLQDLSEHPERNDPAPRLLLRCLKEMGFDDPEDYKDDPEMRLYIEMLREQGVYSYKVLNRVAGSQRFQTQLASVLANARAIYRKIVVEGPPASGKNLLGDGLIEALVKKAQVYAIKGCPAHENPLNVLKMDEITPEHLETFARKSGLGERLYEMLRTAVPPCQCCHKKIMGDIDHPNANPNFAELEVEAIRLSKFTGGIGEWMPGQETPLIEALQKSQRGIINLSDEFLAIEPQEGKSDPRLIFQDLTEYRRLPGIEDDGCVKPPAHSPYDAVVFGTTNAKALAQWLETIPDQEAYTSRCVHLKLPYNTVRVAEVRAYKEVVNGYPEKGHFDPLVLKVLATLVVLSRFKAPGNSDYFVHPIDKLRLYQGEKHQIKPLDPSKWAEIWSPTASTSTYGNPYSSYSSSSSSSSNKTEDKDAVKLTRDSEVTPALLWQVSGPEEGMTGLDMRFMLGVLSSINSFALGNKHKCINVQQVIQIMTAAIATKLNNSHLTKEQKETYQRSLKWLGGNRRPGERLGSLNPELIESEYLRLLKEQFVRVFSPDYDERGQQFYEDYKLHGLAYGQSQTTVRHPQFGQIPVNERLLDELDRFRLNKAKSDPLTAEDKKFRGVPLMSELGFARDEFNRRVQEDRAAAKSGDGKDEDEDKTPLPKFQDTWQTIPDLANAIAAKLDSEISELMEKLLKTEILSNLSEEEQQQLAAATEQLKSIGYCDGCIKPVLEYAKRTKVWSYKG